VFGQHEHTPTFLMVVDSLSLYIYSSLFTKNGSNKKTKQKLN